MQEKGKNILIALFILLLTGLLFSRALLSISTGLCLAFIAIYKDKISTSLLKNPLFLWCVCPLLLLLIGIFPNPMAKGNLNLMLSYCTYPIAGITILAASKYKPSKIMAPIWIVAALIGLLYPLIWFIFNSNQALAFYGSGKSLPVFMDTDHVRFGIFLCCSLVFVLFNFCGKRYKKLLAIFLLFSILFLSVRTAWVLALVILLGYGIHSALNDTPNKKRSFVSAIIAFFLLITAVYILPTVQQKIRYSIYEFQQYNLKGYDANYSDGVRRSLNSIAWKLITTNKANAIGWNAIPNAMQTAFSSQYNGAITSFGWPFNQWLFWWMGSGLIGMLLFSVWLLFPAYYGWKHKNPLLIIWTTCIAFSCLVECTLNYQFGIFLHVWPIALFWNAYPAKNQDKIL